MLKWQEDGGQGEPLLRLPKLVIWSLVLLYSAAFLFVLIGWVKWLTLVLRYNQTLFSLLR